MSHVQSFHFFWENCCASCRNHKCTGICQIFPLGKNAFCRRKIFLSLIKISPMVEFLPQERIPLPLDFYLGSWAPWKWSPCLLETGVTLSGEGVGSNYCVPPHGPGRSQATGKGFSAFLRPGSPQFGKNAGDVTLAWDEDWVGEGICPAVLLPYLTVLQEGHGVVAVPYLGKCGELSSQLHFFRNGRSRGATVPHALPRPGSPQSGKGTRSREERAVADWAAILLLPETLLLLGGDSSPKFLPLEMNACSWPNQLVCYTNSVS